MSGRRGFRTVKGSAPSAMQKRYWDVLTKMGCVVTRSTLGVTIHHCHGGSMKERGFHREEGRKTSNWLVIPLYSFLHTGPDGIDGFPRMPVVQWEAKHGRQADYIDRIIQVTGIDVWELARDEEKGMVPRPESRSCS